MKNQQLLLTFLFGFFLLFIGCSGDGVIKQPVKESSLEIGAKYSEIEAWLKGKKQYQDLSPEAQIAYMNNQTYFESLRLLIDSDKITDTTIREYIISQRSIQEIKKAITTSEKISQAVKDSLASDIKNIESTYSRRELGNPKILPDGVNISSSVQGNTAFIKIVGVIPSDVEFYNYEGIQKLGPVTNFKINLKEGRRFNFKFIEGNTEHFALLTPDMARNPQYVSFLGENISIDCTMTQEDAYL